MLQVSLGVNGAEGNGTSTTAASDGSDTAAAIITEEAAYRVAEACGIADVVPRTWTERIVAVLPETGAKRLQMCNWLSSAF